MNETIAAERLRYKELSERVAKLVKETWEKEERISKLKEQVQELSEELFKRDERDLTKGYSK
jgi:ATP-dependent Lon protease